MAHEPLNNEALTEQQVIEEAQLPEPEQHNIADEEHDGAVPIGAFAFVLVIVALYLFYFFTEWYQIVVVRGGG